MCLRTPTSTPILAALAVLAWAGPAAAVPLQLAHQGRLFEEGTAVTGQVQITFRLFPQEAAGTALWEETRAVDLVDGHYAVLLGADSGEDPLVLALLQQPALWLELSVDGGSPLLPRQPVVSAPYAILAHSAENVSGGSVDATEIRVNGSPVVDVDGTWVGPPPEIDFSDLLELPPGFADGEDADALGGLSCADGDRAAWEESSGLWVCASQIVGLDRIDTAGAVAGDVLAFDGTSVAWSDVVAAGGCSLSTISERVAELTCGTTTVRVRTPGNYVALGGGYSEVRMRPDGTLSVPYPPLSAPPGGSFVALSRGYSTYYCAIDASGSMACQSVYGTPYPGPPAGSYVDAACVATSFCCGVLSTGAITCWDLGSGGPYAPTPSGSGFVQVAASSDGACGRTSAGTVACWESPNAPTSCLVENTPTLAGVQQLSWDGSAFKAVTAAGTAHSWGTYCSAAGWSSYVAAGNYVASEQGLFLRDDGLVVEPGVYGPSYRQGSYIAVGYRLLVRDDGTLVDPYSVSDLTAE